MAGCPDGGGTFTSEGNLIATLVLMNAHGQGKTRALNRKDPNKCVTPSNNRTIATEASIFYQVIGALPPGISARQKNLYAMVSMLSTAKWRRRNSKAVITETQRRLEYFRLSHGRSVPDNKGFMYPFEVACEIVEWNATGFLMLVQADIGGKDEYPGWVDGGGSYEYDDPDRPDDHRSGNLVQRYMEGMLFFPVPGFAGGYDIRTSVEHCSEVGVPFVLDEDPLLATPPGSVPRGSGVPSGGGSGARRDEEPHAVLGQRLDVSGGYPAFQQSADLLPVNWVKPMSPAMPIASHGEDRVQTGGQGVSPDRSRVLSAGLTGGIAGAGGSADSRGADAVRGEVRPGEGYPWLL